METTVRISKEVKDVLDSIKKDLDLNTVNQVIILLLNSSNKNKLQNPFQQKLNKIKEDDDKDNIEREGQELYLSD